MKNTTKPEFITFTGADDKTNIDEMIELCIQYPVEYGILFSPKKQGGGRYPSLDFIDRVRTQPLRLAAHVCGGYSRNILNDEPLSISSYLTGFRRIQINTSQPVLPVKIALWAWQRGVFPILQCRQNEFPKDDNVDWLYDRSGGRGEVPDSWPKHSSARLVGYAGGLNPSNVADIVSGLDTNGCPFWIDMENGVRDEHDNFSIEKCRQVCRAIYGEKTE